MKKLIVSAVALFSMATFAQLQTVGIGGTTGSRGGMNVAPGGSCSSASDCTCGANQGKVCSGNPRRCSCTSDVEPITGGGKKKKKK